MRRRRALVITSVLVIALAGCATPRVNGAGGETGAATSHPTPAASSSGPMIVASGSDDADARAQARAWLDAATLPPGAIPADPGVATFNSWTGWPCGPVAELKAFWSIPGATVSQTANWLRAHPTGKLITTSVGAVPVGSTSAIVGYIPARGAQEGIVYTVQQTSRGVGVRAEIAAQTADATCPSLPDGGEYGAPGQG